MSQSVRGFEKSKECSEDLSSHQFGIVQLAADGTVEKGEGATDLLVGVLQNTPESGEQATYRFIGTSKVKIGAGGGIAVGAWVTSDAAGLGIATTTDADTIIGRALEAGDAGDIIEVQLGIGTLGA